MKTLIYKQQPGSKGLTGSKGIQGSTGPQGLTGSKGLTGDKGLDAVLIQGLKGDPGDKGPDGSFIGGGKGPKGKEITIDTSMLITSLRTETCGTLSSLNESNVITSTINYELCVKTVKTNRFEGTYWYGSIGKGTIADYSFGATDEASGDIISSGTELSFSNFKTGEVKVFLPKPQPYFDLYGVEQHPVLPKNNFKMNGKPLTLDDIPDEGIELFFMPMDEELYQILEKLNTVYHQYQLESYYFNGLWNGVEYTSSGPAIHGDFDLIAVEDVRGNPMSLDQVSYEPTYGGYTLKKKSPSDPNFVATIKFNSFTWTSNFMMGELPSTGGVEGVPFKYLQTS